MNDDILLNLYLRLDQAKDAASASAALDELAQWARTQLASSNKTWQQDVRDCLYVIAGKDALFAAAITRWLTRDDGIPLGKALSNTISVRYLKHNAAVGFDLKEIDEACAILVGYRLCATGAALSVALGWILSLARDFPQSDAVKRAVDTLLKYLADEYPSASLRLLRTDASPFKDLPIAQKMVDTLTKQDAAVAALPSLREFAMTPKMRLLLASLKRSEEREIFAHAKEHSILQLIATEFHFKYSKQVVVEMKLGDQVKETSMAMQGHSLSVDLPQTEATDPLFGKRRRHILGKGPSK